MKEKTNKREILYLRVSGLSCKALNESNSGDELMLLETSPLPSPDEDEDVSQISDSTSASSSMTTPE